MQLEFAHDEVKDISIVDRRAQVMLASGQTIEADKVVLAVGNQAPAPFRLPGLNLQSPKYIANPWSGWEKRLPGKDEDLMIIGTGLTMVDAFLSLKDLGWRGRITAVSRNGLLPLSHFRGFEYPDLLDADGSGIGLRNLFSIFKRHFRSAQDRNLNPAILVDKLRPFTQRIWQNFSVFEKRQFNRHFRTRWNVVRHRIAPEIHQQLQEALDLKRLEVIRGRLRGCEESDNKIKVRIDCQGQPRLIEAGALINCTGPRESYVTSDLGLFNQLFSRGLLKPDELNMGIKIAPNFSVLDVDGNSSEVLFAMGSLVKGTLWETTAVPELRSQAFRLAETIVSQLAEGATEKSAISEVVEDVLEYSI
jgi:uncharacterized NAD(P)/FAD-binding protein YdhS